ncbi:hypothetical protein [Herbiconiux daphne]|uniref:Uncharacterized protein n=1 Tax=Herbiconiux daphne TaxID=2970914 RepID=A0ABT2GYV0_9MICO|nr:hypothetical protein [Herbiconiux daphne]MCS5732477.1 hypothetical protein [Herbiconiux daphne]
MWSDLPVDVDVIAVPAGVSDQWPMLAVHVERTRAGESVHFLVSDASPVVYIGPVVLGIDMLTSEAGECMTFVARFDIGQCTVSTAGGGVATAHPDAVVEFHEGVVTVRTRLGARWDAHDSPVGFCLIDGVPYQVDVPVTVSTTG